MRVSLNRWQIAALASFAASAFLWVWLLALQPVYTAAMHASTPLIAWLRYVWSGTDDMGHGPFLPLLSLYVIYLRRKAILEAVGNPDGRGIMMVLAGFFVFWVGLKMEEVRFCLAALVVWAWAVPFAIWGSGVARQLVFPAGYLLLSIPRWDIVVVFTMKLRLLAAAVAVAMANGIGIATERIGTGIHSSVGAGFNMDVAEACSGLRSVFAMIALAGAYAFFTQKSLWRQWLLFVCAVPVAVIGNIARIVAITIVAAAFGEKAATGFYHDYSGYVVFVVAILLLMELGRLIGRWQLPGWATKTPAFLAAKGRFPVARPLGKGAVIVLAVTPLLLLASILSVRLEPPVRLGEVDFLPSALPVELGGWSGSPLLYCHNEQCMKVMTEADLKKMGGVSLAENTITASSSPWIALRDLRPRYRCPACEKGEMYTAALGEQRLLSGDACVLRSRYSGGGQAQYTVTMVISGASRSSIHNPQLCLPSQGFRMERISTGKIQAGSGKWISVKVVDLEKSQRSQGGRVARLSFVYWYFTKDRQTSSVLSRMLWTAWERAFRHRSERWVMVTVLSDRAPVPGGPADEELLAFSGSLMRTLRK